MRNTPHNYDVLIKTLRDLQQRIAVEEDLTQLASLVGEINTLLDVIERRMAQLGHRNVQ
ncbi:MAG: hypothetical protein ACXVZX_16490 [Terriglobales bacterium]